MEPGPGYGECEEGEGEKGAEGGGSPPVSNGGGGLPSEVAHDFKQQVNDLDQEAAQAQLEREKQQKAIVLSKKNLSQPGEYRLRPFAQT